MGADLITIDVWTTKPDALDWSAGVTEIGLLTPADLDSANYEYLFEDRYDEMEDDEKLMAAVRPGLLADLEEIKAIWEGSTYVRDAFVHDIGPVRTLHTGGLSWGDDPTDTYTVIARIPPSVFEAVGFFDKEVDKKNVSGHCASVDSEHWDDGGTGRCGYCGDEWITDTTSTEDAK